MVEARTTSRFWRLVVGIAIDLRPIRSRASFRQLWFGTSISGFGSQMANYAIVLQVFLVTKNSFAVGLVGLCVAVPTVLVSLFASSVIDAFDRKVVVLFATFAQAIVALGLFFQAAVQSRNLVVIFSLVALQGGLGAVNQPGRRALSTSLLEADELAASAALQSFSGNVSLLFGPALAGVLTALAGLQYCYLTCALSLFVAFVLAMPLPRVDSRPSPRVLHRGGLREGLGFVARHQVLRGALLVDMAATFFGMPVALFPALNAERFGGQAATLGLLSSALALGGIVATLISRPLGRIRRQGLFMILAAAVWGIGLVGVGLSRGLALTVVFLALAGGGDVTSVVLRNALVQELTPNPLRGRVSGVDFAVGAGIPQLGNLRAGVVGSLVSPELATLFGGLTSVVGVGLVALGAPALLAYRRVLGKDEQMPRACLVVNLDNEGR